MLMYYTQRKTNVQTIGRGNALFPAFRSACGFKSGMLESRPILSQETPASLSSRDGTQCAVIFHEARKEYTDA
jgi:hypothetical protein